MQRAGKKKEEMQKKQKGQESRKKDKNETR